MRQWDPPQLSVVTRQELWPQIRLIFRRLYRKIHLHVYSFTLQAPESWVWCFSHSFGCIPQMQMTAVKSWLGDNTEDVSETSTAPSSIQQLLIRAICLNSTGSISAPKVDPCILYHLICVNQCGKGNWCRTSSFKFVILFFLLLNSSKPLVVTDSRYRLFAPFSRSDKVILNTFSDIESSCLCYAASD